MADAAWRPYDSWLDSKIADVNHVSDGPFAVHHGGALLRRFVEKVVHGLRAFRHLRLGTEGKSPAVPLAARHRASAPCTTF